MNNQQPASQIIRSGFFQAVGAWGFWLIVLLVLSVVAVILGEEKPKASNPAPTPAPSPSPITTVLYQTQPNSVGGDDSC